MRRKAIEEWREWRREREGKFKKRFGNGKSGKVKK
jgi:hypothetical protein